MKRSASSTPEPDDGDDNSPPVTPKRQRPNKNGSAPSSPTPWTPEKKQALVEKLLLAGLQATNVDQLAAEVGVSKQQIRNATQKGRNNLRGKLIAFAKTA